MCGRYALYGPISRHRARFDAQNGDFAFTDDYNVAPTKTMPVVRFGRDGREFIAATWGLLPRWVKDPSQVAHPINAKAETAASKPMFKTAIRRSRVLVPACGFYEWKQGVDGKRPYFIRLRNGEPMGMAGLLERWEGPSGTVLSYCILTTEPNELVAGIHSRMPVIIRDEDYDAWLDPELTDVDIVRELMGTYPAEEMEAVEIGRAVGNVRSNGPELIEPVRSP